MVVTAGVLQMGALAEMDEETIGPGAPGQLPRPGHHRPAGPPLPPADQGPAAALHLQLLHPGPGPLRLYSSTKAALVNLTQALADEWADVGVRVNCINPERTATPMRTRAFGEEPEHTLLAAEAVAQSSLDVLISDLTGQVIDVRRAPGDGPTPSVPAQPGSGRVEVTGRRDVRRTDADGGGTTNGATCVVTWSESWPPGA